jgi:hypothetical protein
MTPTRRLLLSLLLGGAVLGLLNLSVLVLGCIIHEIVLLDSVIFELELLEHLFKILVCHCELLIGVLAPHLFMDNSLLLAGIISAFVPLMASRCFYVPLVLSSVSVLISISPSDLWLLLGMFSLLRSEVNLFSPAVNRIVFDNLPDDLSHIFFISKLLEKCRDLVEFDIVHVFIPTCARDSILWLEHEGHRRIVNYNDIGHRSAETSQVLDKRVIVESTMLSEELVGAKFVWIQLSHERFCIL